MLGPTILRDDLKHRHDRLSNVIESCFVVEKLGIELDAVFSQRNVVIERISTREIFRAREAAHHVDVGRLCANSCRREVRNVSSFPIKPAVNFNRHCSSPTGIVLVLTEQLQAHNAEEHEHEHQEEHYIRQAQDRLHQSNNLLVQLRDGLNTSKEFKHTHRAQDSEELHCLLVILHPLAVGQFKDSADHDSEVETVRYLAQVGGLA